MSAVASPPSGPPPLRGPELSHTPQVPVEGCPLCGAPLGPEQEWCLRCGAAARTRLAATPNWRTPLIALGTVMVLAAAALIVALVSLAGQ
jgi:uncharacterized paraquat-inducible protein A